MFSQSVLESLGYYVYLLSDPATDEIFYIGKGKENRVFMHVQDALHTEWESDRLDRIRGIHEAGREVGVFILRHGLTEDEALLVESSLLDLPILAHLTNKVKGHHSWEKGLKTLDEINHLYDAEDALIEDPGLIININGLYRRFMSEEEIYQATKEAWLLGPRREQVKYVIASYRGIARGVYRVKSWYPVPTKEGRMRYGFEGEVAPESVRARYLHKSLKMYRSRGAQNPIKYVNC